MLSRLENKYQGNLANFLCISEGQGTFLLGAVQGSKVGAWY